MSTALVRKHTPESRSGTAASLTPPTLLCNLCQKPLATTCFLCACDCIFCEECTYSHFEQSSSCPTCGKTLSENDFTELVVAEATSATTDIAKTSLQALFSKHSKSSSNSKALPFSDLCYSLIRQIDVVKQSTKFLLKQLLMDSSQQSRKSRTMIRNVESLRNEITQIKQHNSAQRMQLEQANSDLQNRLQARESDNTELTKKIKEQERMLDQFRQLHSGMAVAPDNHNHIDNRASHQIPSSSSGRGLSSNNSQRGPEPPLKGFMMQKEAQQQAQQHAYNARRQPNILRSRLGAPSAGVKHGNNYNDAEHLPHQASQNQFRPFSSNSNGSLPTTPRIRELSSNTGYNFSRTSSAVQQGSYHVNKRRKGDTPGSGGGGGGGSNRYGMSPSTAFTLNQGPHSVIGAQRWAQRDSNQGFSR